jgi:hypothetical protein
MDNTSYGYYLVQQKRDMEQAYQKISAKDKADFKRKMAEINEADADDGQSPPPTSLLFS